MVALYITPKININAHQIIKYATRILILPLFEMKKQLIKNLISTIVVKSNF